MAFDFFPKTQKELQEKTKRYSKPEIRGELFLLFVYLRKKFPSVATPINIDLTKQSSVNVTRAIEQDITIPTIKRGAKINKLNIKYGNGSSGNRGVNNRGNLFEPEFANALLNWWSGKKITDGNMLTAIEHLDETYDLTSKESFTVNVLGGDNTKRPLIYTPRIKITNPKGRGNNIGKSVTDITIVNEKEEIYLSLKLGTTTTFFNVGIRTVIPPDDIKAYNIKNSDGKKLLKLFGIQQKMFCDVFNGKLTTGVIKYPKLSGPDMEALLKSGIGNGYHIIHKMTGKIISKKMDLAAMNKASKVGSATVYYGGKTGHGKRIDIEMESSTYKFKLNIRDTQGKDGYPTRLMCDFSYK
jgi:hypothetical protein